MSRKSKGLSAGQRKEIKRKLAEEKARLLQLIQQPLEGAQCSDPCDQATVEGEIYERISQRKKEAEKIKKIDTALKAMAMPTYGICPDCGEPIDFKRLLAHPEVIYCTECQADLEKLDPVNKGRRFIKPQKPNQFARSL